MELKAGFIAHVPSRPQQRFIAVFLVLLLTVGALVLTPQSANAGLTDPGCSNFVVDTTNNYAGSMDPYLYVTLSSGNDMVGQNRTNNGQYSNFCSSVNGWTAEVLLLGYKKSGTQYIACPGSYSYTSSGSGQAFAAIACDGAQYYEMVSSHRVWFAGVAFDSGPRQLFENW